MNPNLLLIGLLGFKLAAAEQAQREPAAERQLDPVRASDRSFVLNALAQAPSATALQHSGDLLERATSASKLPPSPDRKEALRRFMHESTLLLSGAPALTNLWLTYGIVACELNQATEGWTVWKLITALGLDSHSNPSASNFFAAISKI